MEGNFHKDPITLLQRGCFGFVVSEIDLPDLFVYVFFTHGSLTLFAFLQIQMGMSGKRIRRNSCQNGSILMSE